MAIGVMLTILLLDRAEGMSAFIWGMKGQGDEIDLEA
jgi:hypothetical protein